MAEFIISLADLAEAEGRSLQRGVLRTVTGLVLLFVAGLLAVVGLLLCAWAAYQYLVGAWGPIATALIVGLVMILLAGMALWIANRPN